MYTVALSHTQHTSCLLLQPIFIDNVHIDKLMHFVTLYPKEIRSRFFFLLFVFFLLFSYAMRMTCIHATKQYRSVQLKQSEQRCMHFLLLLLRESESEWVGEKREQCDKTKYMHKWATGVETPVQAYKYVWMVMCVSMVNKSHSSCVVQCGRTTSHCLSYRFNFPTCCCCCSFLLRPF